MAYEAEENFISDHDLYHDAFPASVSRICSGITGRKAGWQAENQRYGSRGKCPERRLCEGDTGGTYR